MASKNSSEFIVRLLDQVSPAAAKVAASIDKINLASKTSQTTFESQAAFSTRLGNSWLAAATAATAAGYAITETLKGSVEAYGRLEEAMTSVQFQSGRTKTQMDDLEAGFKKLSSSMYYGVADIANASLLIGESFKNNTAGLDAFMQSASNLARATGGSLPEAVKTMGVVMSRLDIPDKLKDKVSDLFTVFKNTTGAPMVEIAAGVNTLSNALVEANMPGYENLKKGLALAQAVAVETKDVNIAFTDVKKLIDVTSGEKARGAFGDEVGRGTPEKRLAVIWNILKDIKDVNEKNFILEQAGFGPKALAVITELMHGRKRLADATKAQNEGDGIAAKEAEDRLHGVEGQQDRITNKWKNMGQNMGKGFAPYVEQLLDTLNAIQVAFDKFAKSLGFNYLGSRYIGGNAKGQEEGKLGSPWNRAIPKHAAGGLFTTPHIGMVAEDGPELIIPLSKLGSGMSATERSARGQNATLAPHDYKDQRLLQNPLDSIDSKMTKLVDSFKKLMGGGSSIPSFFTAGHLQP